MIMLMYATQMHTTIETLHYSIELHNDVILM